MMQRLALQKRSGEGTPMILAITLILLILFCAVAEYSRLWIIAQGVREATQQAVISTVNDNYDDVYHAVREGYAAGWFPNDTGWSESVDTGDIYGHLTSTLGLTVEDGRYVKYADGQPEFTLSNLSVTVQNNPLSSGVSQGYRAIAQMELEVPVQFLDSLLSPVQIILHVEAKYVPLF
jgi:hypothetical protein